MLAAILGQQLARPLLLLAAGVEEVARGDLRPKAIFTSQDELGGLTRAFAAMTQQLADARQLAEHSVQELDSARAHLQTVLDNLNAGVLVFDASGCLVLVNPGGDHDKINPGFASSAVRPPQPCAKLCKGWQAVLSSKPQATWLCHTSQKWSQLASITSLPER